MKESCMILNMEKSFGFVFIFFYWIMVVFFFVQFWIGLMMESEQNFVEKQLLMLWYVFIGIFIFGFWVFRVIWMFCNLCLVLLMCMEQGECRLVCVSYLLFLVFFGIILLIGWLFVLIMGGFLFFQIFGLFGLLCLSFGVLFYVVGFWSVFYVFFVYFMLVLVVVYVLVVLCYQFMLKDGLVVCMLLLGR